MRNGYYQETKRERALNWLGERFMNDEVLEGGERVSKFIDEAAKRFGSGLVIAAVLVTAFVVTYKGKVDNLEAELEAMRGMQKLSEERNVSAHRELLAQIKASEAASFNRKDGELLKLAVMNELGKFRQELLRELGGVLGEDRGVKR